MPHWLIKSEPEAFSIQDLARAARRTTSWDGVRNYQARNFLRAMAVGDLVVYYHSNAAPPAAVGIARVARAAYPDRTAWDPGSPAHDPRASPANPIWSAVDVALVEVFPRAVPIDELRGVAALAGMELLRRASRLSVTPVSAAEFRTIQRLGHVPPPAGAGPAPRPRRKSTGRRRRA